MIGDLIHSKIISSHEIVLFRWLRKKKTTTPIGTNKSSFRQSTGGCFTSSPLIYSHARRTEPFIVSLLYHTRRKPERGEKRLKVFWALPTKSIHLELINFVILENSNRFWTLPSILFFFLPVDINKSFYSKYLIFYDPLKISSLIFYTQ